MEECAVRSLTDCELLGFLLDEFERASPKERTALLELAQTEEQRQVVAKAIALIDGRGTYESVFGRTEQQVKAEHDRKRRHP